MQFYALYMLNSICVRFYNDHYYVWSSSLGYYIHTYKSIGVAKKNDVKLYFQYLKWTNRAMIILKTDLNLA